MPPASVDFIYWTFSAAAQSIAAFVAFLLTGYALVHTLMESARERDDTLDEVHATLRESYHRWLGWLAAITGAAIIFSLTLVYFNRPGAPPSGWVVLGVALVDLVAVIAGLFFVVSIIHPAKYQHAAKKAIEEASRPIAGTTPSSEFFDAFLHLERLVRDYLRRHDLYVPSRGAPRMSYSFRQMVEALLANERIDRGFYEELLELNKYRNLVFHGHVEQVDSSMISRTKQASDRLETLSPSVGPEPE